MSLSLTQDLQLKLIGASGHWNSFDGPAIESALRSNITLWRSVLLTRTDWPLLILRDLPHGALNSNSLFIWAEPGKGSELEKLTKPWKANAREWLSAKDSFEAMRSGLPENHPWSADPKRVIFQLWWT